MDEVVLVDENDQEVGSMEKLQAHVEGLLHRAFSVFIFNSKGELLLQKRADSKYHSAGLWTNSCCSHPLSGETLEAAAKRRTIEEIGMNIDASQRFFFIYKAELENDLTEHELDHVLVAHSDEAPVLNPEEASEWKYISLDDLQAAIWDRPADYTAWLKIIMRDHLEELRP